MISEVSECRELCENLLNGRFGSRVFAIIYKWQNKSQPKVCKALAQAKFQMGKKLQVLNPRFA